MVQVKNDLNTHSLSIFSTKQTKMHNSRLSNHPHSHQRPSSPLAPHPRTTNAHPNHASALDLRNFNDYLQQRIARSALRKELQMSRGESSHAQQPLNPLEVPLTPSRLLRKHQPQNSTESRIKKCAPQAMPSWCKHESIEHLLNKENQELPDQNRKTESQHQQALRDLQRKYQQLQQKYRLLMKEASDNAKAFEKDKQELNKLKELHRDDQQVLDQLKREVSSLNTTLPPEDQRSLLKIKSENNISLAASKIYSKVQNYQQMWNSKPTHELKQEITPNKASRYRTCQNWSNSVGKRIVQQEQSRTYQSRYNSAQKPSELIRRSNKCKKGSDHTQYSNMESKTSIRYNESLKGSRMVQGKPSTETCIGEYSKATPSTLQKKMISPKAYQKYRFQPNYKLG